MLLRLSAPALAFLCLAPLAAGGVRVLPRGEPQLFVDDSRISQAHALQRTLRQPRKDDGGNRPVLELNRILHARSTLEANGSIVYDPQRKQWVMYCLAFASALSSDAQVGWQQSGLIRYTSPDAINWNPEGRQIFPLTREDLYDEVTGSYARNLDACTVWIDPADAEWPYKAWFWLARIQKPRAGAYYYRSKDGITFERGAQVLVNGSQSITQDGWEFLGPEDTSHFVPDPVTGRFLALIKFHAFPKDGFTASQLRSRAYLFVDRIDEQIDASRISRLDLVPALAQERGDFPYDEYYDSTAYRYGSHWLGELRIWHGHGDHPWSAAGCAYLKFMSSEDGLHWRRAAYPNDSGYPEVFLANGLEGGNEGRNDGGYMTSFSQPPLRIGDELIFYYASSSYGKNAGREKRLTGGGVFRARLRLDGFVSVDSGWLTTVPFRAEGDELKVNAVGPVKVELLAQDGKILGTAGTSGDGVRQPIRFDGRSLRSVAGGEAVQLRFTVEPRSALYAFLVD